MPKGTDSASVLLSQTWEQFQSLKIAGVQLILSVRDIETLGVNSDNGLGVDFSQLPGFHLFAENLLLAGDVKLAQTATNAHGAAPAPAASNTICVDALTIQGAAGKDPVLNASGQDGPAPPPAAPAGGGPSAGAGASSATAPAVPADGGAGGHVTLFCERLIPTFATLGILARGGAGSAGQTGSSEIAGGDGGDGGRGGQVLLTVVQPYPGIVADLTAAYRETDPAKLIAAAQAVRKTYPELAAIAALDAIAAASTIDANRAQLATALEAVETLAQMWNHAEIDVSGGDYGPLGQGAPSGHQGFTGDDGLKIVQPIKTWADLASLPSPKYFLWAHPSQIAMLLEKARLLYLTLDPASTTLTDDIGALKILLDRIIARTAPAMALDATKTTDPLVSAIAAAQAGVAAQNAIASFQSSGKQAQQMQQQLAQGLNFFGRRINEVPAVSYSTIKDVLSQAVATFATIEGSYQAYYKALADASAQLSDFTAARDAAETALQDSTSQRGMALTAATATAAKIDGLQQKFAAKRAALDVAVADYITVLENLWSAPSLHDFLGALGSIAMAPDSELNWIAQSGSMLDDSINTVENDQGQKINKAYLIRGLRKIDADVASINEGSKALPNGTLQVDDPGAGKLVADEQAMLSMLDGLSGDLDGSYATIKTAFDAYIAIVQQRNEAILQYNAQISLILQLDGQISDLTARSAALTDSAIKAMNGEADWPELTGFASRIYYQSRTQILQMLDMTARAYRFWALDDHETLSTLLGGGGLPQVNAMALSTAMVTLLSDYINAINNFGGGSTPFPVSEGQRGILVPLSPAQIAALAKPNSDGDFEVFVRIPVADKSSSIDENPFAGKADVRITEVRLYLDGGVVAQSPTGAITIELAHTGAETILNPQNVPYQFRHDARTATFSYIPDGVGLGKVVNHGDFGYPDDGPPQESEFALYGPFTTWHVKAPLLLNQKKNSDGSVTSIDLGNIKSATLEFFGNAHAFASL